MREFCGSKKGEQNKIAWVRWKDVCCPRSHGGLGIKHLKLFNETLIAKWRWHLFHQRITLWVDVLEAKYEGWRGLLKIFVHVILIPKPMLFWFIFVS